MGNKQEFKNTQDPSESCLVLLKMQGEGKKKKKRLSFWSGKMLLLATPESGCGNKVS